MFIQFQKIALAFLLASPLFATLTRTYEMGTSQATYITNISNSLKSYFAYFIPYTTDMFIVDSWGYTGLPTGGLAQTYNTGGHNIFHSTAI